jgi:hypothetical protein
MTAQQIVDRHYTPAYDRIWADASAPGFDVDAAIERTHRAWLKVAALIHRVTGKTA